RSPLGQWDAGFLCGVGRPYRCVEVPVDPHRNLLSRSETFQRAKTAARAIPKLVLGSAETRQRVAFHCTCRETLGIGRPLCPAATRGGTYIGSGAGQPRPRPELITDKNRSALTVRRFRRIERPHRRIETGRAEWKRSVRPTCALYTRPYRAVKTTA